MIKKPRTISVSSENCSNGNGNHIQNLILLSLPQKELDTLLPKLEFVRLGIHHVLHEVGETIKSGYFINTGIMSVLAVQPDGKSVEIGLVGREGFVGLPLLVGYSSSPARIVTQADCTAYRCSADVLRIVVKRCPLLEQQLHRFGHRMAMQTAQIAACNLFHDVEERLARWILMTGDRVIGSHLSLTQDFLGQMLGTRRSSVTVAAGVFQKAGVISYKRGDITILDRERLQDAACDCYSLMQKQLEDWDAESKLASG